MRDTREATTDGYTTDPLDGVGREDRPGRRRWPWVLLVLVLLLVGGYVAAAQLAADRVARGTTVLGADVGGMTEDDARAVLEEVAAAASRPVAVTVGEAEDAVDPAAAGLQLDVDATLSRITPGGWSPRPLLLHVTGGGEVAPVERVDEDALAAAMEDLAARVDSVPVDGSVTFPGGVPTPSPPQEGRSLDQEAAAEEVLEAWPRTGETLPLALPAEVVGPAVDEADVAEALATTASAAASAPVTLAVADREVQLAPAAFGDTLSLQPVDGALVPVVDGARLREALLAADPDVEVDARDALIELQGGRPVVVPAVVGRALDPAALAEGLLTALAAPDRRAVVALVETEPELLTAEAQALGVKEVVSTFSTNLTSDEARTENLRIAATTMNGTLVLPGEVFSLNEVLGQRTAAKGYNEAGVISGGRLSKSTGGGVSQVATTTFNAMFFAGLEDVEHRPHSFYISRYPEGREATISWRSIDLKWRNDSPYGVMVQSYVADGQITVTFWSTKVWDIEAVTSPRTRIVEPQTIVDNEGECVPQDPVPGFDVTVTRIFKQGGVERKREEFDWRYIPQDDVTCGPATTS